MVTEPRPDSRTTSATRDSKRPRLLRMSLVVTALILLGQLAAALTQILTGAFIGTGVEMDAYLAAVALPNYVIAVVMPAVAFVFIPVFVKYRSSGQEKEAWEVASHLVNVIGLGLLALALIAIPFAGPLVRLLTPGLRPEAHALAVQVAWISWPGVTASGIAALLIGVYHANGRFYWAAGVQIVGYLAAAVILVLLVRPLGVLGLAVAMTAGQFLQVLLLAPFCIGKGRYRWVADWNHPGVRRGLGLLWPLLISSVFLRASPLVDRYLASGFAEGSISALGYAFNLSRFASFGISAGVSTIIFVRLAEAGALGDMRALRATTSMGLRMSWLVIAPVMLISMALAEPVVRVVLERGTFNAGDSAAVAPLFLVYQLSMIGIGLGNITARALYALQKTHAVAVCRIVEVIAYLVYDLALVRRFGVIGTVIGFALYINISLAWQFLFLARLTGSYRAPALLRSFALTSLAAVAGGAVAAMVARALHNPWLQVFVGGIAGLGAFVIVLLALGSEEGRSMASTVARRVHIMKQLRATRG
jgi:putative peptidoglycan lipid II flippase